MNWNIMRQQAAAARATTFGEPGLYTPPEGGAGTTLTVRLKLDVEVPGEFGEVIERRNEMKLLASEISARRNATVTVDGIPYQLTSLIEDTGIETRWTVKQTP